VRAAPFLLGLALVSGCVLALEVLDTRLLSVLTWYSLAFLVIAMGLFGLTAGAVYVYLRPERYAPERLATSLASDARRLALAVPVSYALLLLLPLRTEPVATTVVLFVAFAAAIALPFVAAGSIIAAALTRSPLPVGRVYAVDLIGAALGAVIVPPLLRVLDGGSAILAMGAVAALASVAFARAAGDRRAERQGGALTLAMLALSIGNASTSHGLVPLWVKGRAEDRAQVELELWNSFSRVQVLKSAHVPAALWGGGTRCLPQLVHQRGLEIDGHASSPLYLVGNELERLRFLDCDVTNAVHRIRPRGSIAIIGVGGSRDIQAALLAGHRPIVGIELNDRVIEILTGPLGRDTGIPGHPDVRLVVDEARSWLERHPQPFEVIQASLIDTWAATGAGAHALGENSLYTVEAFRLFLSRLAPGGVLSVSRWSTVETARLVALAVAALLEQGSSEPRQHLALLSAGAVSTLLVARDPLPQQDVEALRALSEEKGFALGFAPGTPSTAERLERVLSSDSRPELDRLTLLPALDFRPPTDDRPFFFNVIRPSAIWSKPPEVTRGTIEGNLVATRTLGLALLASLLLSALAIVLPLWRRARPARRVDASLWAAFAYFAAIGVGFMLAEIALLMRLSLILGNPAHSLMIVLASLVGAAGLGALVSDRLPLATRPWCFLFPLLLAAVLVAVALGWPASWLAAASSTLRIAAAAGICALVGACLGVAFPAGLRLARREHDQETPWLWGINGVASVLASSTAILIALRLGLSTLLLVAAGAYLVLVPAALVLSRERAP
jgi:spermidine synthase